jgi:hypothetical protein
MAQARAGRLTIGLPVRNGASYLASTLANLLTPDIDGLVVAVSDNASTAGTEAIVRDAAARDPRVRYFRQPRDVGANRNFNDVFLRCDTPYFKWAAVDDLCDPDLFGACLDVLDHDPGVVLAYGRPRLIDEAGVVLAETVEGGPRAVSDDPVVRFADVLTNEVWCTPVFGVVRARELAGTGLLRPFYGADKVLLAELALRGRFARVAPTFYRRCHEQQSTVLDARAKAAWTTGGSTVAVVPAVVRATRAYASIAWQAEVTPLSRVRALVAVARTVVRGDKLRKLVVPGPYNYFGWTGRRHRGAYDALDLSSTGALAPGADARAAVDRPGSDRRIDQGAAH